MDNNVRPTVTILTTICSNQAHLMKLLCKQIKSQTYKNIVEWIIIDTTNKLDIDILKEFDKLIIKYFQVNNDSAVYSTIREQSLNALGQYLIWMNPDYYYFDHRINYIIDKLSKSHYQLACCSNIYAYIFDLKKLYKINTNIGTFAYNSTYINNSTNTNNCLNILGEYCGVYLTPSANGIIDKIINCDELDNSVINHLIPTQFYDQYSKLFNCPIYNYLKYDIVYLMGNPQIIWDPTDMSMGGSEQAIVYLSENWVKMGKSVVVYGNINKNQIINGVHYINYYEINLQYSIKTLIIWRTPGIVFLMKFNLKADKIIIDFHDNFDYTLTHLNFETLINLFKQITKFNFKSQYHLNCFENFVKYRLSSNQFNIIPNGVRLLEFSQHNNIQKNPFRYCYCSSYDRGLEYILTNIWPLIYQMEPKSELHVYYGMDYIYNDIFKNKIKSLLDQPGVTEYGRQPMSTIIKEKYLSTFHLYLSHSTAEIDCISIKESLVTGCIPIITNTGVFAERHGIHYQNEPPEIIARDIVNKSHDFELIQSIRDQLQKSSTIIDWNEIAIQWLITLYTIS
jgi:hypothetical protein